MRRGFSAAFAVVLTGTLAGTLAAQQTKLGTELQVNSFTVGAQALPSVAADPEGDFVVVWYSDAQDGEQNGIFGQRFSSAGGALAGEFRVNAVTQYDQFRPDIAMAANGNFIVVWQDASLDGFSSGIVARRFSSAGTAAGREFVVNQMTLAPQVDAAVSSAADGDFVVVWTGDDQGDNYGTGVKGRVFSSAGVALTDEFQVNSYTEGPQYRHAVAMHSDGDFVVTWKGHRAGSFDGIVARRYSSAGAPQGDEFVVSALTESQNYSAVTFAGSDFVVAWDVFLPTASGSDVFIRRFSSVGVALAAELQVNTHTFNSQSNPDVAAMADGGVVVAWESVLQDGDGFALIGRRFSSAGDPVGGEFQINTTAAHSQHKASVAADGAGRFVVAWQAGQTALPQYMVGPDGSYSAIFLQRFGPPVSQELVLDVDASGDVAPLTDGLVAMRYLFNFTGSALTDGAVDTDHCTRCGAGDIETYVGSIAAQLDIDDDGENDPLTDGRLILRYLFGLRGSDLVDGAVDEFNCDLRCDAPEIETYLEGLSS